MALLLIGYGAKKAYQLYEKKSSDSPETKLSKKSFGSKKRTTQDLKSFTTNAEIVEASPPPYHHNVSALPPYHDAAVPSRSQRSASSDALIVDGSESGSMIPEPLNLTRRRSLPSWPVVLDDDGNSVYEDGDELDYLNEIQTPPIPQRSGARGKPVI